ncbi:MAG TPA: hypothetical protein VFY10_06405 [Dehalococcoidia bacterium]|nr:hypothetical protein [Dehalococcoidia bacterium]
MKNFYSSFLLRIRWDREQGILGGEIRRAPTDGEKPAVSRRFRGFDIDRIVDFVKSNLETPRNDNDLEAEQPDDV